MSELLGVRLSLGLAWMGDKPENWVFSGQRCKLEGTGASDWAGICLWGVPVMLGVGKDVVTSTVILTVSEV